MSKEENVYYVYLHRRGDNNEVFYVGKGKKYRAGTKHGRNKWWHAIVNKCGFAFEYVEKGLSEQDAFDLEVETIRFYRECGHTLCNLTDGGEGGSGVVRKQPIVDGATINLNIFIPKAVRNKTRRWKIRNSIALHVVIVNLLTCSKMYYKRDRNKSVRTKDNLRGLNNHAIMVAVAYLVQAGFVTSHVSDKTNTPSYVVSTAAFNTRFDDGVVQVADCSK